MEGKVEKKKWNKDASLNPCPPCYHFCGKEHVKQTPHRLVLSTAFLQKPQAVGKIPASAAVYSSKLVSSAEKMHLHPQHRAAEGQK